MDQLLMIGNQIGAFHLAEVRFYLFEHFQRPVVTVVARCWLSVLRLGLRILQEERIVVHAEESGAAGVGPAATDADETGKIKTGCADLLGDMRAERREFDAA